MVPKHTCLAESANQSQPKVTSHCPLQQATVVATDVVVLQNVQSLRCKKSITNQKCKKNLFCAHAIEDATGKNSASSDISSGA